MPIENGGLPVRFGARIGALAKHAVMPADYFADLISKSIAEVFVGGQNCTIRKKFDNCLRPRHGIEFTGVIKCLLLELGNAGGEAIAVAGDVRSEDFHKALVSTAVSHFDKLDIAFNNAGTLGEQGASTEVSEAGFAETLAINLTAAFLAAKHQVAAMKRNGSGSLIFTSTVVGYSFAFPGVAAYAASKSGLIGLTQAFAAEFGPDNVRVNAILPGAVDTDMYREANGTTEKQAFITNLHALKRVAKPQEIAQSVLYLASDESSFVSGTASLIDGGASITRT